MIVAGGGLMEATARLKRQGLRMGGSCLQDSQKRTKQRRYRKKFLMPWQRTDLINGLPKSG